MRFLLFACLFLPTDHGFGDANNASVFRHSEITDTKAATACVIGEVHPGSETFYVRMGN